jgi:hypothetical protein
LLLASLLQAFYGIRSERLLLVSLLFGSNTCDLISEVARHDLQRIELELATFIIGEFVAVQSLSRQT